MLIAQHNLGVNIVNNSLVIITIFCFSFSALPRGGKTFFLRSDTDQSEYESVYNNVIAMEGKGEYCFQVFRSFIEKLQICLELTGVQEEKTP